MIALDAQAAQYSQTIPHRPPIPTHCTLSAHPPSEVPPLLNSKINHFGKLQPQRRRKVLQRGSASVLLGTRLERLGVGTDLCSDAGPRWEQVKLKTSQHLSWDVLLGTHDDTLKSTLHLVQPPPLLSRSLHTT